MDNTGAETFWSSLFGIPSASITAGRKALETEQAPRSEQAVVASEALPTSDCLEHLEGTGVGDEATQEAQEFGAEEGHGRRGSTASDSGHRLGGGTSGSPRIEEVEGDMGQHGSVAFTTPPYVTDAGALVEVWEDRRARQEGHGQLSHTQVEDRSQHRRHRHTRSFTSTTTTTTTTTTQDYLAEAATCAFEILNDSGEGLGVGEERMGVLQGGRRAIGQAPASQAMVAHGRGPQAEALVCAGESGPGQGQGRELAVPWDGMGPPPTVALATVTHASGQEVVLARDLEVGGRMVLKGIEGSEQVRLWLSDRTSATLHATTLVAKAGKGEVTLTLDSGNTLTYRVERAIRQPNRPNHRPTSPTSTALCLADLPPTDGLALAVPRMTERETQLATILVGLAAIHRDITGLTLILMALVLMGEAYKRRLLQLQLDAAAPAFPLLQDDPHPHRAHPFHHPHAARQHHRRSSSRFENALWDLELITERCTLGGPQREAMQDRLLGQQGPTMAAAGRAGAVGSNSSSRTTVTTTTTTTTTSTSSSSSSSDAYVRVRSPKVGGGHARHVSVTTSSTQEVKEVTTTSFQQSSSVTGAGDLHNNTSTSTTHVRRRSMQCSASAADDVGNLVYPSGGGRMVVEEVEDEEGPGVVEEEERLRREMAAYQRGALAEAREVEQRQLAEERRMEVLMAEMPERYLSVSQGVLDEARRRWRATLAWRDEQRVGEYLDTPHVHFDLIKRHFPQYMAGRDKRGIPVYYESTAQIDAKQLKANGIGVNQLLWHQVFICEFIYAQLITQREDKMVTVIDVSGLYWSSLPSFLGDPLDFVLKALMVAQRHYPERNEVLLVINAPSWFSYIWNLVKHVFEEWATRRLRIVTEANSLAALRDYIDEDQIPEEYGGKLRFGNEQHSVRFTSPFEVALRQHVEQVIEKNRHRLPMPIPQLTTV